MLAVGTSGAAGRGNLVDSADVIGATTLDALRGTDVAFDERIHKVRPQPGQDETAANLRRMLEGSEIRERTAYCGGACRTPTRCAAFRRCTARCATRWRIAADD